MELIRATPEQHEKLKKLNFPINKTSKHPTPTLAFALMWFREELDLYIGINIFNYKFSFEMIHGNEPAESSSWKYKSHGQCESAGLDCAIKYFLSKNYLK